VKATQQDTNFQLESKTKQLAALAELAKTNRFDHQQRLSALQSDLAEREARALQSLKTKLLQCFQEFSKRQESMHRQLVAKTTTLESLLLDVTHQRSLAAHQCDSLQERFVQNHQQATQADADVQLLASKRRDLDRRSRELSLQTAELQTSKEAQETARRDLERRELEATSQSQELLLARRDLALRKLALRQIDPLRAPFQKWRARAREIRLSEWNARLRREETDLRLQTSRLREETRAEGRLDRSSADEEQRKRLHEAIYRSKQKEATLRVGPRALEAATGEADRREALLDKKRRDFEAQQERIRDLALQLKQKDRDLSAQKKDLDRRASKCDECEVELRTWQKQLCRMAKGMHAPKHP